MNPHVRLLEMKHWNSSDIKNKNTIYWLGIKPELNYKLRTIFKDSGFFFVAVFVPHQIILVRLLTVAVLISAS